MKTLKLLAIPLALVTLALAGCANCPVHRALFGVPEEAQEEPAAEVTDDASAAAQQGTCPVMGGKAVPGVFADYQGRRVYFCCPGCVGMFKKSPEKYLAKLDASADAGDN